MANPLFLAKPIALRPSLPLGRRPGWRLFPGDLPVNSRQALPVLSATFATESSLFNKPLTGVKRPEQPEQPKPFRIPLLRSIDGSGNNLKTSSLNTVGASFQRLGVAHFGDNNFGLRQDLPNARLISNVVVAGQGETPNREGVSGMMYAWGQFIDHDINLTFSDGVTSIAIPIPGGDPVLTGSIAMTRAVVDPQTGLALNHVTGWLDGSMVYGSDEATATSLRGSGGYLLTSSGNNLPIANGGFQAGDIRVQENPDLTALQVLFVREHNRQVDQIKAAHPNWSDEQLYQQARAVVTAEIAKITYSEFLPHLLGQGTIRAYQGYNPNVDSRLTEEFAGAAFRFGHSIVSANIEKISESGSVIGEALSLKEAFFQAPEAFAADGGADGLLRHLAADRSNALDVHIVDDLRNFLFGPGSGLDLAAINIQRGRDLGLGSLNETRLALGLKPYRSFEQITSDRSTQANLQAVYGSVDKVELWIGGLAENHINGGMVGETFSRIISKQFQNLRDGDRLWYQNQGFDPITLQEIEGTSLASLILRNTDTKHLQADAFTYVERRGGEASGGLAEDPLAPQLVVGADGSDRLIGGSNQDLLVAGSGRQVMTGLAGADTFILSKPGTEATITDFTPGLDHLQFERHLGASSPADLWIGQENGHALVRFGSDSVTLLGLGADQLRPSDIRVI